MDVRSDYWVVRGQDIEECKQELLKESKEDLVALVINNRLNSFMANHADKSEKEGKGKRIPYIGWFWRSVNFVDGDITIGDCGDFIGFMENNKWDYPERELSKEEVNKVLTIVWEAKRLSEQGGMVSEIVGNTNAKLEELWELLQTFKI